MLDLKLIRAEPGKVRDTLANRGMELDLDRVLELDERRRQCTFEVEQKRAERTTTSKQIAKIKQEGGDAEETIRAMRALGDEIDALDAEMREVSEELDALLLEVPNIPRSDVPIGLTEEENEFDEPVGEAPQFDFAPKGHWELGEELGIIDFPRATKLAGARFDCMIGAGATLERALINFFLDVHTQEHGYVEVLPPFLGNTDCHYGTANLPKYEDDLFKTREGLYLIPTAEVPLTNLHRDEILDAEQLPLHYTAYTPCWRSEAGAAGKETRGLIRLHQFHKVELMKYATPEQADEELEGLIQNAETILQRLGLCYRRVRLCTGDITFASAKTIDLEVWMPGMDSWVEISSCSIYDTFQARRCNCRFRRERGAKPEFVVTMNGSGLAAGRTMAAIIENYQRADGSIEIPRCLQEYMAGRTEITAYRMARP